MLGKVRTRKKTTQTVANGVHFSGGGRIKGGNIPSCTERTCHQRFKSRMEKKKGRAWKTGARKCKAKGGQKIGETVNENPQRRKGLSKKR